MRHRYARFTRSLLSTAEHDELAVVDNLAEMLVKHIEARSDEIDEVHVHGAGSSKVQAVIGALLRDKLGFRDEVVITPEDGLVTRVRADFFYRLSPNRGILAEVERGGTTTNNHDLKDVWKAHIAPDAHHLFLIVPIANWNGAGHVRERPFIRVRSRVAAFFGNPRREIDVLSAHVFGYGTDAPLDP